MKVLRYLIAVVLVCGFATFAHADTVDFHMGVLDPPPLNPTPILGTGPFNVTFGACPAGFNFDGCFEGQNDSGKTFQSLELIFPNTSALGGQAATCDTTLQGSIFTSASCSLTSNGTSYVLSFFGGSGLPSCRGGDDWDDDHDHGDHDNGSTSCTFIIVEDGVDPSSFPTGTGTFSTTVPVPEPGTMMLLSTGISMLGLAGFKRR